MDIRSVSLPRAAISFNPKNYLTIIVKVMRFLGQWPTDGDTLPYRAYAAFVLWVLMLSPSLPQFMFIYINTNNLESFTFGAYLTICMVLSAIKMLNVKFRWRLLSEILSDCLDNYEPIIGNIKEYEIMTLQQNKFNKVFTSYCYFIAIACTAGLLAPCFDQFTTLPIGVWYPGVDVMTTPYYQSQYMLEVLTMGSLVMATTIYDNIITAILSYCIGRMQCLRYFFENIKELAKKKVQHNFSSVHSQDALEVVMCQLLKKGVVEHKALECIIRKLELFYWPTIFLQFFCTSVNMCCAGIQVLTIESNLAQLIWILLYVGCLTIQTLLPAWYAHEIIKESEELLFGVYSCKWIGSSPRFLRMLRILQERLKRPLVLDIGIIGYFSLELFASMMTLGYRMFAVMRTIYDSNKIVVS